MFLDNRSGHHCRYLLFSVLPHRFLAYQRLQEDLALRREYSKCETDFGFYLVNERFQI